MSNSGQPSFRPLMDELRVSLSDCARDLGNILRKAGSIAFLKSVGEFDAYSVTDTEVSIPEQRTSSDTEIPNNQYVSSSHEIMNPEIFDKFERVFGNAFDLELESDRRYIAETVHDGATMQYISLAGEGEHSDVFVYRSVHSADGSVSYPYVFGRRLDVRTTDGEPRSYVMKVGIDTLGNLHPLLHNEAGESLNCDINLEKTADIINTLDHGSPRWFIEETSVK